MSARRGRPAGGWRTAALALAVWTLAAGCGEKINIPRPEGLFSVAAYTLEAVFPDAGALQVAVASNSLFVLGADGALVKRTLAYAEIARNADLGQPTAFGPDDALAAPYLYVWEQGPKRLKVLRTSDLAPVDSSGTLAEVQGVTAVASCRRGIELVAGARTFLYMGDPVAGVIHRYAYTEGGGFVSYGILARADGEAARFVHVPAGMTADLAGRLLVCDPDTARHWVIRFDPTPDLTDISPDWNGQDPLRGLAVPFDQATCEPTSAADVTLGYAAECGQTDWVGRASDAEGEFDTPLAVAVDGSGRIFVVDSGNDRIQIFTAKGYYEMQFGSAERLPAPASLGLVDWRVNSSKVNYGAYLFILVPGTGEVRKFISSEQYIYVNQEPPPPS